MQAREGREGGRPDRLLSCSDGWHRHASGNVEGEECAVQERKLYLSDLFWDETNARMNRDE